MVQTARVERIHKRLLRRILTDQAGRVARVRGAFQTFRLWEGVITHKSGLAGIDPL